MLKTFYTKVIFCDRSRNSGERKNEIIKVQLPKEGKKSLKNDKTYERIADHIGFAQCDDFSLMMRTSFLTAAKAEEISRCDDFSDRF